jgi:hypothetical protein
MLLSQQARLATGSPSAAAPAISSSGYSPLLQLPDGTILNAPHVAVQGAQGRLSTHPKVLSVAPDKSSVVFQLTQGFSQGQPIVYISTGASHLVIFYHPHACMS